MSNNVYKIDYAGSEMDLSFEKSKFVDGFNITSTSLWSDLISAINSNVKLSIILNNKGDFTSIINYDKINDNKFLVYLLDGTEIVSTTLEKSESGKIIINNIDNKNYLTITALETQVEIFPDVDQENNNLEYCLDGINWEQWSEGAEINLQKIGDSVKFRRDNESYIGFTIEKKVDLSGNIMSIVYGEDFEDKTSLSDVSLSGLFSGCSIVNAKDLLLPATTLGEYCYSEMFKDCYDLETAPSLPSLNLAPHCYESMFSCCGILEEAPELRATNLADSCYSYMFEGCTSLAKAPNLPATNLADFCYNGMFSDCTSLPSITLIATSLGTGSYHEFVNNGCISLSDIYINGIIGDTFILPDNNLNLHVVGDNAFGPEINVPSEFANEIQNVYLYSGTKWVDNLEIQSTLLNNFIGKELYIDDIDIGPIEGGGGYTYNSITGVSIDGDRFIQPGGILGPLQESYLILFENPIENANQVSLYGSDGGTAITTSLTKYTDTIVGVTILKSYTSFNDTESVIKVVATIDGQDLEAEYLPEEKEELTIDKLSLSYYSGSGNSVNAGPFYWKGDPNTTIEEVLESFDINTDWFNGVDFNLGVNRFNIQEPVMNFFQEGETTIHSLELHPNYNGSTGFPTIIPDNPFNGGIVNVPTLIFAGYTSLTISCGWMGSTNNTIEQFLNSASLKTDYFDSVSQDFGGTSLSLDSYMGELGPFTTVLEVVPLYNGSTVPPGRIPDNIYLFQF